MKEVFITGASGCVGQALLRALSGHYRIRALFRAESDASRLWQAQGVQACFGDLSDEDRLLGQVRGAEVVFHSAATMVKNNLQQSVETNLSGTERLARAAAKGGSALFVHISSISVYAATKGEKNTLTEEDPPQNIEKLNNYSRTKLRSELAVNRICAETGMTYIIIRPTNVYGPYSQPWFLKIVEMVRKFPVLVGDVPIDLIHVDDLAAAIVKASETRGAFNQTFNIGHEMMALREFVAMVAEFTGRKFWFLPKRLDASVRYLGEFSYRAFRGKKASLSLIRPAYYPHTKARDLFHFCPKIRIRDGLKATASWYRHHHAGA